MNVDTAPIIRGTGGLRKLRFAPPSWNSGKSGSARVCFVHFAAFDLIVCIEMFTKSEKANVTAAEANVVERLISRLDPRNS